MSTRRAMFLAVPALALTVAPFAPASAVPAGVTPTPVDAVAHTPAAPVFTGDIVVKFRDGSPAKRTEALARVNARQAAKLTVKRAMAETGRFVVTGAGAGKAQALARALAADPNVVVAEPDIRLAPAYVPNDPYYGSYQWDLQSAPAGIDAPTAWDKARGAGVTVAVLDTGATAHPDMAGKTVAGYDFISDATAARDGSARDADPADQGDWSAAGECGAGSPAENSSWHGTHVAGTVAAATGNGAGTAGVAPDAKVQHVRVLGKCGGSMSDIADAVTWASGGAVTGVPANATPAKVLNLSLGGAGQCYSFMQSAVDGAVGRGSTVVVAAGNENVDASGSAPANCNNVVTVGATGPNGTKSSFSNYGAAVDLAAPGGEGSSSISTFILSGGNAGTTTPSTSNYVGMVGTSQATPHVAGVAALMLSVDPTLTPAKIESTLKSTTHAFASAPGVALGTGILDAAAAVNAVSTTATPTPSPTTTTTSPTPSPTTTTTSPSPSPTTTTPAAPTAVNDAVTLSTRTTSAKVNVLANDKTTATVTGVTLTNAPCTNTFCLKVNSDKTIQVTKSKTYRGTTSVQYTLTQSDGQKASATLSVTS